MTCVQAVMFSRREREQFPGQGRAWRMAAPSGSRLTQLPTLRPASLGSVPPGAEQGRGAPGASQWVIGTSMFSLKARRCCESGQKPGRVIDVLMIKSWPKLAPSLCPLPN